MDVLGIFGLFSFIMCLSLSSKVKRLEQIIKSNGLNDVQTDSLRNVLKKYIGKTVQLSLHDCDISFDLLTKQCLIEDVDEAWALVKVNPGKKDEAEKIIRIDLIKNITLKQK